LSCCMEGLAILPDNPALSNLRRRTEKEIFTVYSSRINSYRTEEALLQAEKMLKIYPRSAVAWLIKSLSMQQKGEIQGALEAAKTAVRLSPETADAHFVLGTILCRSGQMNAAITEYNNAMRLSERPQKSAIYSQAKMLDILTNSRIGSVENIEAKSTSEKKMLGLTGVLERTADETSAD